MKRTKMWWWIGGAVVLGLLFAVALAVVPIFPRNYLMSSAVMEPSLPGGTMLWVRHSAYASIADARRGDVIVFSRRDQTTGAPVDYVTRVIGLPGDRIKMAGTGLQINGRALPHVLARQNGKVKIYRETQGKVSYQIQYGAGPEPGAPYAGTVAPGKLFCLGDNRDDSYDSRFTGAVPFADVRGKRVF